MSLPHNDIEFNAPRTAGFVYNDYRKVRRLNLIRRWKIFSTKEKLIFLLLFAVLLPTVVLLAGQYFALSALRDKSRAAFENDLRQNFSEIENKTQTSLQTRAEVILRDFPNFDYESWDSEQLKQNLNKILEKNEDVAGVFVFVNNHDKFSLAKISREKGYLEGKSLPNPGEAARLMGDDDFVIPLVPAIQNSKSQKFDGKYLIGQKRCENCAENDQNLAEYLYLYRILSDESSFDKIKVVGVQIKQKPLVEKILSPIISEVAASSAEKIKAQVIFGIFNEQGRLIYTNAENAETLDKFELQNAFGRSFPLWTLAGSFRDSKIEDLSNSYFRSGLITTVLVFGLLILGVVLLLTVAGREVNLAKAKSAFVSNVSHELKTPLALIRLFAETLQSGRVKDPEKINEYYRIISNETRRLTMLIDNILDFSAIEAGRKEYDFVACDLSEVVEDVARNYTYSLENSGFKVQTDFAQNLPMVPIDCDAVSQAVLNLLNNASKYSTDDKFIRVSVGRRDENIFIEVTDHGIGIAPDEQEKIFEDFYRVGGSSDVHNVKGSGLGLSLVKHIVEAHGGHITVSSVLHRGTTFTISLPIERSNGKRKKL